MKKIRNMITAISLTIFMSAGAVTFAYGDVKKEVDNKKTETVEREKLDTLDKLIEKLKGILKGLKVEEDKEFTDEEIDIGDIDDFQIKGSLTMPSSKKDVPLVIIAGGSGPTDRDASIGPNKVYKDIAEGLAERGIATYRFDKRIRSYAQECAQNLEFTPREEYIEDIERIFEYFSEFEGVDKDRIYIAGHSLGGHLMPRAAERVEGEAGVIIIAGNVQGLNEIMPGQVDYLINIDGIVTEDEKAFRDKIYQEAESLKKIEEVDAEEILLGAPKSYWGYLFEYDPLEEASNIDVPVMVLQGKRDYQVDMKQYQLWFEAFGENENWTFKVYDKLNHLLMKGEGKPNPMEYNIPSHVSEELVEDMAEWILSEGK